MGIGTDIKFLQDREVVRFFDVDGVLCTYAFGNTGVNACHDEKWEEYLRNNDPYENIDIPNFMIEYLKKYTKKEYNYVVTHIGSMRKYELKKGMILRKYGNYFYPTHIHGVMAGDSKNSVIKDVLRAQYGGLGIKHSLIDDTVSVLSEAQEDGITTLHISSLLLLARLV